MEGFPEEELGGDRLVGSGVNSEEQGGGFYRPFVT